MSVVVTGPGTVIPNLDGQILQSGSQYQMKAKPAWDSVFGGWSGDVTSSDTTLTFIMESNMVLQANFAPNPFPPAAGKYQGAVTPVVSGASQLAGSFKAVITRKGKFAAKVQLRGVTYPLSGVFLADGSYSGSIYRKKLPNNPIELQLQMDINNRNISGIITDTSLSVDPTGQLLATFQTNSVH